MTSSLVVAAVYRLPYDDVARQAGLCSTSDTVSVHFTFKFNNRVESSNDAGRWDASFAEFTGAVMKSPGGVVATSCSYGWGLNRDSYCASFRYLNIDTMQSFLQENETNRLLRELRSHATGGIEVEFLETRVFSHGWQGSVDHTQPQNPGTAALFGAQGMLKGIDFNAIRGE